jgi:hypothetical protein
MPSEKTDISAVNQVKIFDILVVLLLIGVVGIIAYPYITNKPFTTDVVLDAISPIIAIKGSKQDISKQPSVAPTPFATIAKPTITYPTAIPTVEMKFVDPYTSGERFEGQWYKWFRQNVSGFKHMNAGVVVYRHAFLDGYTWWDNAMGQYFPAPAPLGRRYFAVWIHEELLGDTSKDDGRFYGFRDNAFQLQYKSYFLLSKDENYNPVNWILEFNSQYDYYNTVIAQPFGYVQVYTGHDPETGGYSAQTTGWLVPGKGNAIDGYIIYEVPGDAQERDLMLIGNFASFGNAYWRFANGSQEVITQSRYPEPGETGIPRT